MGLAQDQEAFQTLITSVKEVYNAQESYELEVSYTIYRATDPTTIQESHTGDYVKNGSNIYSKIGAIELVHIDETFLQINHDEKAILFTKQQQNKALDPLQLETFTNHFESIQVEKKDNGWVCELSNPKLTGQFPYEKIEIHVDQNFQVRKQILHPIQTIVFSSERGENSLDRSIIYVEFSDLQPYKRSEVLQLDTYVSTKNTIVRPSVALKEYQLIKA
jgi:hypothetical protein